MKKKRDARVICFSNHKGGVGKTCSTCNVGAALASIGKKTLLIDLDPQANLSLSLGIKDVEYGVYNSLRESVPLDEITYCLLENFYICPSSLDLAGAEMELSSEAGRETILRELIDPIRDQYDYVLIDCPPSLGLLTLNALTAADEVFIPLQAQYLAVQGVDKLQAIINKIKSRLNRSLTVGGVIITCYDKRKVLNRDVAEIVKEFFEKELFQTKIRDNISLAEAPSMGQDIFRYSPKSRGAEDYRNLSQEMLERHSKEKRVLATV